MTRTQQNSSSHKCRFVSATGILPEKSHVTQRGRSSNFRIGISVDSAVTTIVVEIHSTDVCPMVSRTISMELSEVLIRTNSALPCPPKNKKCLRLVIKGLVIRRLISLNLDQLSTFQQRELIPYIMWWRF